MVNGKEVTAHQTEVITNELQRRHLVHITEQTGRLITATQTAGQISERMIEATNRVQREVAILADSSDKMERLTVALKRFTIWLLAFGAVRIAIAGLQTWKMFQGK